MCYNCYNIFLFKNFLLVVQVEVVESITAGAQALFNSLILH